MASFSGACAVAVKRSGGTGLNDTPACGESPAMTFTSESTRMFWSCPVFATYVGVDASVVRLRVNPRPTESASLIFRPPAKATEVATRRSP